MASTWSLFVILFVAVFGGDAFILEDDPLIEKIKAIVAKADSYVSSKGYDEIDLPNVGARTDSLLELRNGKCGVLSSMTFQSANAVNETKLADGSTLYTFDINVGLSQFFVNYDFEFSAIIIKKSGNFSLSVLKNTERISGSVVVKGNSTCEGKLTSAAVTLFTDYQLTVSPGSIPHAVTEAILDLVTPKLLPSLNKSIKSGISQSNVQNIFSSIACSVLA